MHTDERGIFDGTIRAGIANAIGIDELLQLDTGHLKVCRWNSHGQMRAGVGQGTGRRLHTKKCRYPPNERGYLHDCKGLYLRVVSQRGENGYRSGGSTNAKGIYGIETD